MSRAILAGAIVWLLGCAASAPCANFSSIFIFGDSVLATSTNNATGSTTNFYYGKRYCNGRTWGEVLVQRQGLGANSITNVNWNYSSNNVSFFGQYSSILVTNVGKFVAPTNATNCLFVVWVCDADFVGDMNDPNVGNPITAPQNGTNIAAWTSAINQHLTNHFIAITNLYAKGCRALIAPNAVDVTAVPEFNTSAANYRAFVRQRIVSFNTNYVAMLTQIAESNAGLVVYIPDMFGLLDSALTNAASYGLTNALYSGSSIDAIDAYGYGLLPNANLNGPGTNYIFWDRTDPTAKFGEVTADIVQQLIAPAQITNVSVVEDDGQLGVASLPIGLNGFVDGCTNLVLANWTTRASFSSTNATQTIIVPADGPQWFYRLRFPYAWSWP